MQGDCSASPPAVGSSPGEVVLLATPRGMCRLLTSAAFLSLPSRALAGAPVVSPAPDVWIHGLHVAQLNASLAATSPPALAVWAPAAPSQLWVTRTQWQSQSQSWQFTSANAFVAGTHVVHHSRVLCAQYADAASVHARSAQAGIMYACMPCCAVRPIAGRQRGRCHCVARVAAAKHLQRSECAADTTIAGAENDDPLKLGALAALRGSAIAIQRATFRDAERAAFAASGARLLLQNCTFRELVQLTATDQIKEPGFIYTDASNNSGTLQGDVAPLREAPDVFLQASNPAFTALRQVRSSDNL